MSAFGIFGIAKDLLGKTHIAYGAEPEFNKFIECVKPDNIMDFDDENFYLVNTTDTFGIVTAKQEITLSSGERRPFSCWKVNIPGEDVIIWPYKDLPFAMGQTGWVGIYFGIKLHINLPTVSMPHVKEFDKWLSKKNKIQMSSN